MDDAFRPWLAQYIRFEDSDGCKQEMTRDKAHLVLVSPQLQSRLPYLRAVNPIRMPYFKDREKGIIDLLPNGWHEETQTFTIHQDFSFDTDWTAERAKEYLLGILESFPFVVAGSFVRRAIRLGRMPSI